MADVTTVISPCLSSLRIYCDRRHNAEEWLRGLSRRVSEREIMHLRSIELYFSRTCSSFVESRSNLKYLPDLVRKFHTSTISLRTFFLHDEVHQKQVDSCYYHEEDLKALSWEAASDIESWV